MIKQFLFCSFLFLFSLLKVTGQEKDSVKYISLTPIEFQTALQKETNAILVDVRESFEYRSNRIRNAINIPASGNLDFATDTINKESPVYLYCTSGFRSKRVAKKFCEKGFTKVYSLDGGIVAWRKCKLHVDKKRMLP
jgi:thioredoxin 1